MSKITKEARKLKDMKSTTLCIKSEEKTGTGPDTHSQWLIPFALIDRALTESCNNEIDNIFKCFTLILIPNF